MYTDLKPTNFFERYTEIIMSIIAFSAIIFLNNSQQSLVYLGILIIALSIYQVVKVRNNTELLILFGVITYVNTSVALGDLLQISQVLGDETLNWQMAVRMSEYNALGAKSILLVLAILNMMISWKYLNRTKRVTNKPVQKRKNNYIFYVGMCILIIFLIFGYAPTIGDTYQSSTRTIYEYCLIIFIVTWFYSGNSKTKNYILHGYAIVYVLQALSMGDRSSAFPMLLIIFLINNIKIDIKKLAALAIGGILISNLVSAYRLTFSFSQLREVFSTNYGVTALLSDTVSQSYYTGISIINVRDLIPNTMTYFFDFLGGIIMGGSFGNADVGAVANGYLLNKGGGFYFSWFYFWFGFIGVILGSITLGYVIRWFFSSTNNYMKLYKIAIVGMSFRWYLYTPFVLFRTVLFMFTLLLFLSYIVEKLTVKKRHIKRDIFDNKKLM